MSDLADIIWGIAFLTILLGGIPYAIWTVYSAFKRKWKRVAYQLATPVIVLAIIYAILSVLDAKAFSRYLVDLFDTEVKPGEPIYRYDSSRSFNGDGYSFIVYELPESIRQRFEAADQKLLTEFPKRPGYRKHWEVIQYWKESPSDSTLEKYLDFALRNNCDKENKARLTEYCGAIRKALSIKGTFYAFFANITGDHLGDIDLFIIDLEGNRLYVINHNT